MKKIIECVPNFSEGKDKSIIDAISAAIKSVDKVKLLNVDSGEDFNRTVYTFVGDPDSVLDAAFRAAKIGLALIDMRKHKGEHARMGALDVCPFIPIEGVSDRECIEISKKFGEIIAERLRVPVFLYAKSAKKIDRIKLPEIRKGEYEGLEKKLKDPSFKPDYGESKFNPKSGVIVTGCRDVLLAYNINLDTDDKAIASKISGIIRTSGVIKRDKDGNKLMDHNGNILRIPGRFKGVQAGGMMYDEKTAQVSMNLLNYKEVNLHQVFEAVKLEAKKLGVEVTGSEIVGLVPKNSLVLAARYYSKNEGLKLLNEKDLIELAIERLGLSDLYIFKPEQKVIEYIIEEIGPLISMRVVDFLSELSSNSPAPGGGSVAAISGGFSAALTSMVCNLTLGKEKYSGVQDEIKSVLKISEKLRNDLTRMIDEDTNAFNQVIKAFKLPKNTDVEKKKRNDAIQKGYRVAAEIPLLTARTCAEMMKVLMVVAEKGNINSITDVGVSAIMAKACVESAILNVKINLKSIKDEKVVTNISNEVKNIQKYVSDKTNDILQIVNTSI
jgi:glutamate formiminotransferase/formiminotetrahydrofolate cyclodeaminase